MSRDKFEMFDHRMAGKADLSGDLETLVTGRYRRERHACIHYMLLDAVETPEKIEMPPRAAEFAVCDRLKAHFFLFPYDAFDLAIFCFLQVRRPNLTLGALLARFLQRGGPKQAADMIGAEWRFGTLRH
jgi:hypothetical protein